MNRTYSIALALAASLLVVPACKKDKKEGEEGKKDNAAKVTDGKGGDKAATPDGKKEATPDKSGASASASASDLIGLLPKDSEVVVSVNFKSITGSSMWKKVGPMFMAKAGSELGELKEACGLDPIASLDSVVAGFNSAKQDEPVIAMKGIKRAKFSECVTAMKEKKGEEAKLETDGAFDTLTTTKDGKAKTQILAWASDDTAIMMPEVGTKELLQARLDGKDSLKENAAFGAFAAKAKQSQPLWFAASFVEGSEAAKNLSQMAQGKKITGVFGSVGFEAGLQLAIGAGMESDAVATETATMASGLLAMAKGQVPPPVQPIVGKVKIAAKGSDLTVDANLTDADLESLMGLAGPMLGGM